MLLLPSLLVLVSVSQLKPFCLTTPNHLNILEIPEVKTFDLIVIG